MGCCKKPVHTTTQYDEKKGGGVAPAATRKCHDVLCCLVFLVFWIGMVIIAIIGLLNGKPQRLLYGTDYLGETCGTGNVSDRPLTFYPRMTQDLLEQMSNLSSITSVSDLQFYGVCVSACPEAYTYFCNYEFEAKLAANTALTTDEQREAARKTEAAKWLTSPQCWFVALPSEMVFYRCLQITQTNSTAVETCIFPADSDEYYSTVNGVRKPNDLCQVKQVRTVSDATGPAQSNPIYDKMQSVASVIGRCIGDISDTWPLILGFGAGIALVLGFVYIVVMKYCAGCIVWITLWAFVLLLLVFALLLSSKAGIITDATIAAVTSKLASAGIVTASQNGLQIPENLRASEDRKKVYAIAAYVFYALSGIAFLLVCFFQKRIRITVGIIKEASRALQRLPLLVLFPIWPFLMILILFIYSAIIAAFIYSTADIKLDQLGSSVNTAASTVLSKVNSDRTMQILFAYHFFGFLWTNQLIHAISMCTIAGAICRYYWSRNKTSAEMGRFPILYSFKNCFRYHFGSLAFGSFIIAVVQFIRAVLMYIDHQTQGLQKSNLMVKVVLKVVQCCLWCLEKCLRFLSKNAYIMIAMKGKSFCGSAKDAFMTIFKNIAQVGTVSLVSMLLLTTGKIAISMACSALIFIYIEKNDATYGIGGTKEIASPMAPILLTLLLAWFVASSFLGVYEMAIDTILLCFCEDREMNRATGQYFMSDQLRQYVSRVSGGRVEHAQQEHNAPATAAPAGPPI